MATPRFLIRSIRIRSLPSAPHIPIRASHHQPGLFASLRAYPTTSLLSRRLYSSDISAPGSTFSTNASSSSSPSSTPSSPSAPADPTTIPPRLEGVPHYQLTFTCKPCSTRSSHRISHQGYNKGTVLISCPECKARHLIADHLKIFSDTSKTIEDILREKNEGIVRGVVGEEESKGEGVGDIEFWRKEEAGKEGEVEGEVKSLA